MKGKLYIVATPIGNLKDLTFRAIETLKEVDFIVCESIKVSRILLTHYEIKKQLVPLKTQTGASEYQGIVDEILVGKNVAYIVDAGTPCISDPGSKLSQLAIASGIEIVPIPGASALISALSVCGLPTDKFVFYGFIPHKKGRRKLFEEILANPKTSVFYDSKHRIKKTLSEINEIALGHEVDPKNIHITIESELTKKFERIMRGNLAEINEKIQSMELLGEYVVILKISD